MKRVLLGLVVLGVSATAAAMPRITVVKHCELFDRQIYAFTRVVSGHTLKHLAAAAGVGCVEAMLRMRRTQ
jgi:hypothetical protein